MVIRFSLKYIQAQIANKGILEYLEQDKLCPLEFLIFLHLEYSVVHLCLGFGSKTI